MEYIYSKTSKEGLESLAQSILDSLNRNGNVLWLISGGSNVPIAVKIMKIIRSKIASNKLNHLIVTLTDERFGPVNHKDSNWKQLKDSGFNFSDIKTLPILKELDLESTTKSFSISLSAAIAASDFIVGQFGIGHDGHIAGILPNSVALNDSELVNSYVSDPFTRITISPKAFRKISLIFVFAFGESKIEAIQGLLLKVIPQPANLLKEMKNVYLYSDIKI